MGGYWAVGGPLLFLLALKGGRRAWEDIQPLISPNDSEKVALMYYQFFTVPKWPGTALFLLGILFGLLNGFSDMAATPAVNYAFAELRISIWVIAYGIAFVLFYQLIRQLNIIRDLYTHVARADIFNPQPLYGFPRYTAIFGAVLFFYVYLTPIMLGFNLLASGVTYAFIVFIIPFTLLIFYLPLAGMHNRLVEEKEALRAEVGNRIRIILRDIHRAAFDKKDFEDMNSMIAVHAVLLKEKETIEDLSAWPWRPATLTGLVSAILLPIVLSLVQDVIYGWLGL